MPTESLIDGIETDCLPISDRGLQYADGLFETIAVRHGGLCLWRRHFNRLARGCERLGIPVPRQDLLLSECLGLADGKAFAVLKAILTRGSGGRGYRPPKDPRPSRILSLHPWPDYPPLWAEQGVDVIICRACLGESPMLAGLKHLNRLEQVMARLEWQDPGIAEGLMLDGRNRVIAGTMSNLFLVRDGRLITPRLETCGIAGTVRALVLRVAGTLGLEAVESDIRRADLAAADGLFLTNSLIGIWPVRRLGVVEFDPACLPGELIAAVRRAVWAPEYR